MSDIVLDEINNLQDNPDIDIILVPLPVMTALKDLGENIHKCRVCRVKDRGTKELCADKFCV